MKSSLVALSIILASLGVSGQSLGQSVIPGVGPVEEEELRRGILEEGESQPQPDIFGGIPTGTASAGENTTVSGINAEGVAEGSVPSQQTEGVTQRVQQQGNQIILGGVRRTLPFVGRGGRLGQIPTTAVGKNTSTVETPVTIPVQVNQQRFTKTPTATPFGAKEKTSPSQGVPQRRRDIRAERSSSISSQAVKKETQDRERQDRERQVREKQSAEAGQMERQRIAQERAAELVRQRVAREAAEQTRQKAAVDTISRAAIPFLARTRAAREAAEQEAREQQVLQENTAARAIQGPFRAFLARREEQWRQDRIARHEEVTNYWNGTLYPERQRHEAEIAEYQQAAERIDAAYGRLGGAEQAAWDAADEGGRAQLVAGYGVAQEADRRLQEAEAGLAEQQALIAGTDAYLAAAIGRLADVRRERVANARILAGPAAVAGLDDRTYGEVKRAYTAKQELEDHIGQWQRYVVGIQGEVHGAVGALHPAQQLKWNAVHDFGGRQALGGEYDEIAHETGTWKLGGRVVDTPSLLGGLGKAAGETQDALAAFNNDTVNPFLDEWHEEYINTLNHVPPLALSKSLREAEERGKDIVDHVLRVPSAEAPIVNYQEWSTELKNRVVAEQVYGGVSRLDAQAGDAHGDDVKAEARDRIIDHLTHSRVATDLAWTAYGNSDLNGLSYAQKGALIKGYLAATGRDPHNPEGETWDEAHYAALQAGVPGLQPFQEIVGNMRGCKHDEERAHTEGEWDDDFDC